jgi:O-succinylbenzoate synthase
MTISLDKLEALAKAASDDWLAFIAACDPATILKLLAVVKAAKAVASKTMLYHDGDDGDAVDLLYALADLDTP